MFFGCCCRIQVIDPPKEDDTLCDAETLRSPQASDSVKCLALLCESRRALASPPQGDNEVLCEYRGLSLKTLHVSGRLSLETLLSVAVADILHICGHRACGRQ